MGDKCFRGNYKVLWELRAAGHSFFPCWKSWGGELCGVGACWLGLVGLTVGGGGRTPHAEKSMCKDRDEGENLVTV